MAHLSEDYIRIIAASFIFGGGFLWQAIKRQKRARQIEDTPKSLISAAPQGLVELQGFAWPINKGYMSASGHELVYYHLELQKRQSNNSKKQNWVTVYKHEFVQPFYILDPTGLATVVPTTGELEIESTRTVSWSRLTQPERNFYLDHVIPMTVPNFPPQKGIFGLISSEYRIVEREVRTGCPIYVSGDFKTQNAEVKKVSAHGLTHFANRVIDFTSRNLKNLKGLLDKNNDGRVCSKEAKDGYSFAAQMSKKKTEVEKLSENEFEVFGVVSCSGERKLYLADAHESHVVDRLKKFQYLRITGGSALVALALVLTVRVFVSDAEIEQAMTVKIASETSEIIDEGPMDEQAMRTVHILHQNCVSGNGGSCVKLLESQARYKFDQKYIQYYTQSACRGGVQSYCEDSGRVPSSDKK